VNTGQVISGACHAGLIAWAVLGGAFQAEPLPFEVTEVTAISSEDYALLIRQQESPEAVANVDTPEPPEEGETAPELQSETDEAPELDQPEVADTPPPDDIPEVDETPPAEAEVSDEPPILEPPQEDVAVIVPDESSEPKPRPAPRVAPEPVAQPEPDVEIDEVQEQESVPDETTETPREDTEATSPEEANIVFEALNRRDELDSDARLRVYRELADHFRAKTQFPNEAVVGLSDEQYLRNTVDTLFNTDAPAARRSGPGSDSARRIWCGRPGWAAFAAQSDKTYCFTPAHRWCTRRFRRSARACAPSRSRRPRAWTRAARGRKKSAPIAAGICTRRCGRALSARRLSA